MKKQNNFIHSAVIVLVLVGIAMLMVLGKKGSAIKYEIQNNSEWFKKEHWEVGYGIYIFYRKNYKSD
jgi:hypothetical protein